VTSEATNRTSRVHHTNYNEDVSVQYCLQQSFTQNHACLQCPYFCVNSAAQHCSPTNCEQSLAGFAAFIAVLAHFNCALQGYQFTCATRRSYWLHWDTPFQLSPDTFSLHKPDLMNATHGWLYLTAK
jgi:hypothetical protein